MSDKNDLLRDILDSLSDEETEMIEKTATDAGSIKETENKEAREKVKGETPSKEEKKLGLSILGKNKYEEDVKDFKGVDANSSDGNGTENISVGNTPVEPGTMFEKKASADAISQIYALAGIDLQKTASEGSHEDMLLKVAYDTMEEMKDLEKVAEALAEETAERFMRKIQELMA